MNATEAADLIRDLEADLLVGTDEGTHGRPETVRVYERLDGTRYAVHRFAGSVIGTGPIESEHGRLRTWRVISPAARRDLISRNCAESSRRSTTPPSGRAIGGRSSSAAGTAPDRRDDSDIIQAHPRRS